MTVETYFENFDMEQIKFQHYHKKGKPKELKNTTPFFKQKGKGKSVVSYYQDKENKDFWIEDYLHQPFKFTVFKRSHILKENLDNPVDFLNEFMKQIEFENIDDEYSFRYRYEQGLVKYFEYENRSA